MAWMYFYAKKAISKQQTQGCGSMNYFMLLSRALAL